MTSEHTYATDDAGIPAPSHEFSATVGTDGPLVLQDHYLIEQMANFNRERIPERQPHAKGSGAFLKFEVTQDVSAYTKAAVFQPGETTEGIIRFSTVAGERGSPDTWRDPRGWALKLYSTTLLAISGPASASRCGNAPSTMGVTQTPTPGTIRIGPHVRRSRHPRRPVTPVDH